MAAATLFVAASYGQSLIGGFDFTSSYSDLALDGPASNPFVSFNFQDPAGNIFQVTDVDSSTNVPAGLAINSANRTPSVDDLFDGAGSSLLAQNLASNATSTGGFFDFGVNAGAGNQFDNIEFGFGASITQAGESTVSVLYSLDGGTNFTSLGTQAINTTQASGGQAVSILLDPSITASDITFRVNFDDIDTGANFDNLQVSGTVVPEPSTYAAIFGVIALGFVAYRRRK